MPRSDDWTIDATPLDIPRPILHGRRAMGATDLPSSSERTSFFEAQAAHRASARAWSAASALLILGLGSLYGFLMLLVVSLYGLFFLEFFPKWFTAPLAAVGLTDNLLPAWFLWLGGILLAGGVAVLIRSVLGTASLGAIESAVGLRTLDSSDLEERQLANIVGEMAIAGGVPEPRVLLMEGEVVNAGAAGHPPGTVFVSRRLLDHLDRDETQGVLGHLLATMANGDSRVASGVLTVLQTLGFFMTLFDAPFSPRARRALASMGRYLFRSSSGNSPIEAHRVASQLTLSLQPEGMNDLLAFMERTLNLPLPLGPFNKVVGSLLLLFLMPLILSRLAGFITYSLLTIFVLGPFVAFAIRARRRLADATAVQLTRNPDGLARALIHLTTLAHPIHGVGWAEMLFIVGSEITNQRNLDRLQERVAEIRAQAPADLASRAEAAIAMVRDLKRSEVEEGEPEKHGFIYRFHPSLNQRIIQLKRMGANVAWQDRRDHTDLIDGLFVGVFLLIIAVVVFLASRS